MAVSPDEEEESDDEDELVELRGGAEGVQIKAEKEDGKLKTITDPRKPSDREVEDHNRTHLPYRNWCPHCVKAKGKDLDHQKAPDTERGLNEYSFDYCFPGNELGYKLTVLVGRERTSRTAMASVIPSKVAPGDLRPTRCWLSWRSAAISRGTW